MQSAYSLLDLSYNSDSKPTLKQARNWALLWSDIFTFWSKSRDLKSIKKMMVFGAKKLLLDREIAGLQFSIFKDQSNTQLRFFVTPLMTFCKFKYQS